MIIAFTFFSLGLYIRTFLLSTPNVVTRSSGLRQKRKLVILVWYSPPSTKIDLDSSEEMCFRHS